MAGSPPETSINLPLMSSIQRYEAEDDSESADQPLLPTFTPSPPPPPSPTKRSRPRLALLVLLAAGSTAGGLLAWRTSASGVSPSATSYRWPQEEESEHLVQPSEVTSWLATHPHNNGTIPFSPAIYPPLLPLRPLAPTLSVKGFSPECADKWISQGELCPELSGAWGAGRGPRIDVAWTWTNGSAAERMSDWRQAVSDKLGSRSLAERAPGASVAKHFRLRSILKAFDPASLRALHLIVGDAPACAPSDRRCLAQPAVAHEAQVPHWLNLAKIEFAAGVETVDDEGKREKRAGRSETRLVVHPHSALFKTPAYTDLEQPVVEINTTEAFESDENDAEEWRNRVLPSFNSLAIESQIVNMADVTDTLLNLNDDFFVMRKLAVSDISSPITGPVFRLQRDLGVAGVASDNAHEDPDGEWRGLGFTNWLLDQRFGTRSRPYLVHEGKSVSLPLLREAQDAFVDELTATAESRFRGLAKSEIQSSFLLVHFTIEKHREALLWSFFFGRSDQDQDGVFSPSERDALLASLDFDPTSAPTSSIIRVFPPVRTTLEDFTSNYDHAGLERPKETTLQFSSSDGYPNFVPFGADARHTPWPSFSAPKASEEEVVCEIDVPACFGADFLTSPNTTVADVFRRVAHTHPLCGDCVIVQLLSTSSSRGLSAFLPPPPSSPRDPSIPPEVAAVGLGNAPYPHLDFSLPPSLLPIRERCVALIQRYSYVLGASSEKFVGVRSPWTLVSAFKDMDKEMPAFLAINDDLGSMASDRTLDGVNEELHKWFGKQLGVKSKWEN
ncbi:hypothetical protein RQP46_003331 [Phenoliferia psychrophenolica]